MYLFNKYGTNAEIKTETFNFDKKELFLC